MKLRAFSCLILLAVLLASFGATAASAAGTSAVCKIGTQTYTSLADAVQAAEPGQTITMLADASLSAHLRFNRSVTIEGAGFTLQARNYTMFILEQESVTVTVNNLKLDCVGGNQPVAQIRHGSALRFNRCEIRSDAVRENSGYFTFNNKGGSLSLSDCEVQIVTTVPGWLFACYDSTSAADIRLDGVTTDLTSGAPYVGVASLAGKSKLVLGGSTALSVAATAFVGMGTVTIEGGARLNAPAISDSGDIVIKGVAAPEMMSGASLRITGESAHNNGLRFSATLPVSSAEDAEAFGILVARWEDVKALGVSSFTREALDAAGLPYAYCDLKGAEEGLTKVGDQYQLNLALVDLPDANQDFAARAWATYQGQTVYSVFRPKSNVRNLTQVANAAFADARFSRSSGGYVYQIDSERYSCYTEEQYRMISQFAATEFKNSHAAVATVTGSAADPTTWIYQETRGGVMIREITIDVGSAVPTDIVQLTDLHFTAVNASDNETVKVNAQKYPNPPDEVAIANVKRCMEYAADADQIVCTGDLFNVLSYGSIELAKKHIWTVTYSQKLMLALGNHDVIQTMSPSVNPETLSFTERMQILETAGNWGAASFDTVGGGAGTGSIHYSSRQINNVVLIAMDNASMYDINKSDYSGRFRGAFWSGTKDLLERDLKYAKENGCIVLLFYHVPMNTGNPADVSLSAYYVGDKNSSVSNFYNRVGLTGTSSPTAESDAVYRLITGEEYSGIIKGAFCGHEHNDFYMEIQTAIGTIPQFVLNGTRYTPGHVLRIHIK